MQSGGGKGEVTNYPGRLARDCVLYMRMLTAVTAHRMQWFREKSPMQTHALA